MSTIFIPTNVKYNRLAAARVYLGIKLKLIDKKIHNCIKRARVFETAKNIFD